MSWGSVLAGAVVAGASIIVLSLLGVALGAGGLRFTQTTASDMAGYGLGAGIWTAINLILSMAFGAYVAARLSGTHSHLDAELHGITVWAVAILLMTVLLAQAAGSILGTVASTAGTAASSAVGSAGSLASGVAQQIGPQGLTDQLQQSLTSSGDPTQMTRAQITSEIAALAGRRVVNGSLTDQERDRIATLVAAQAGVSKEEAARRVAKERVAVKHGLHTGRLEVFQCGSGMEATVRNIGKSSEPRLQPLAVFILNPCGHDRPDGPENRSEDAA
jgi:hypothetical protein